MLKKLLSFGLLMIAALLLQACNGTGTQTGETGRRGKFERVVGKQGGKVVHRVSSQPKSFNYLMADDEPTVMATVYLIGSRLAAFNHEKQEIEPALAESWEIADDGVTVTVKLREGIKFSDGRPITAEDAAFTLKCLYDERTKSPVFGPAFLVNGKQITANAVNERELRLTLPERVAAFTNFLDNLVVLPKHALEEALNSGKLAEAWKIDSDPASIVTSGPFMVERSVPGERVVLKRNPHYWRKDAAGNPLPYLDQLVIEVVPDANNAFSRLNLGEIDIFDRIRSTDYAALKNSDGPVQGFDLGPGLANDHFWFNLNPKNAAGEQLNDKPKYKWFADKRFRRAISHAVDRDSIATTTLQGLATPVYGFVPAGNRKWLDPELPAVPYDLERSRELLQEAGFVRSGTDDAPELKDAAGNAVEFTLLVGAENEPRKLAAAVIQQDLAKLGIKMQIAPLDTAGIAKRANESFDYDAIFTGLNVTGLEPSGFASFLLSSASVHQWHPKQASPATEWEARIDKLFAEQSGELNPERRQQIVYEIQRIIAEESPIIPVVTRHIVSAANKRVGNLMPSAILPYSMWNVEELFIRD